MCSAHGQVRGLAAADDGVVNWWGSEAPQLWWSGGEMLVEVTTGKNETTKLMPKSRLRAENLLSPIYMQFPGSHAYVV